MTSDDSARLTTPLVCDMTSAADSPQERMDEYGRLFQQALLGRGRSSDGLTFTFRGDNGVEPWVRDLSRRESECCAFSRTRSRQPTMGS